MLLENAKEIFELGRYVGRTLSGRSEMAAMMTRRGGKKIEVSSTLSLRGSILEMEEAVQEALDGAVVPK